MYPQMKQNLATMAHLGSHKPVSSQNNWYWSSAKTYLIHEIPLCGLKVVMWCTIKAKQINGPIWHSEAILVDLQDEY